MPLVTRPPLTLEIDGDDFTNRGHTDTGGACSLVACHAPGTIMFVNNLTFLD
jgi:hypothetical protein